MSCCRIDDADVSVLLLRPLFQQMKCRLRSRQELEIQAQLSVLFLFGDTVTETIVEFHMAQLRKIISSIKIQNSVSVSFTSYSLFVCIVSVLGPTTLVGPLVGPLE